MQTSERWAGFLIRNKWHRWEQGNRNSSQISYLFLLLWFSRWFWFARREYNNCKHEQICSRGHEMTQWRWIVSEMKRKTKESKAEICLLCMCKHNFHQFITMTGFKAHKYSRHVKPYSSHGVKCKYLYIIMTNKTCQCCGLRTNAKFEPALETLLLLQAQMHLLCYDEHMKRNND